MSSIVVESARAEGKLSSLFAYDFGVFIGAWSRNASIRHVFISRKDYVSVSFSPRSKAVGDVGFLFR